MIGIQRAQRVCSLIEELKSSKENAFLCRLNYISINPFESLGIISS